MTYHIPNKSAEVRLKPQIRVERHAELASTSGEARERARRGELTEAVSIVAEVQTGGYGRRGRRWESPRGGLWWSLAWPVEEGEQGESEYLEGVGLRIGGACLDTVTEALRGAGVVEDRITLKWPNDVLIDGKKVSGCLCEMVADGARAERKWLIIGVGMNVNNDPEALSGELRRPPTSLSAVSGTEFDLGALAGALTERVCGVLGACGRGESLKELQRLTLRLYGLDGLIEVCEPNGIVIRGTLVGLSDQGRLAVMTGDGRHFASPGAEIVAAGGEEGTNIG